MTEVSRFIITAKGANHTRKEYSDGEPVRFGSERKGDRNTQFKRYGYNDVIALDPKIAKSPGYAHLKLVPFISAKATKPAAKSENASPSGLPKGWRDLAKNEVRRLAAQISGQKFNEIKYEEAFDYLESVEKEAAEEAAAGVIND